VAVREGARRRSQGPAREADLHVAAALRRRRLALGLAQAQLADMLGVTHQQLHKYEAGASRITIGRLARLAEVLGVGVGHFYEGLGTAAAAESGGRGRAGLGLARNFAAIADPRRREALLALARALAGTDEAGPDVA
jgi:transcriptional regulator with XRE-family HTH domain